MFKGLVRVIAILLDGIKSPCVYHFDWPDASYMLNSEKKQRKIHGHLKRNVTETNAQK